MANLNKLSFTTYEIDDTCLNIPMEDIKQEFDTNDFSKQYLFKIAYISKHLKDGNYIVYLSPMKGNSKGIPIVKATIPLELIRTNKLLPLYEYNRELTQEEKYVVNERTYRLINDINKRCRYRTRFKEHYVLVYGYMVNKYKNDNALTKIKSGIQEFHVSTEGFKYIRFKNYETKCLVTNKWSDICKALGKENMVKPQFEEVPEEFFIK